MQWSFAESLSNIIVRNCGIVDITVTSKSYSVQSYAAVRTVLRYYKTNIPTACSNMFKVNNTTLVKGVNLLYTC